MPSASGLTVVVSAGQSRNPKKRELEQAIADRSALLPGVSVLQIPHLYDLVRDGDTYQALRAIEGDIVVLTWLFDRATHWILDRNDVRGQVGVVELVADSDDDEDETEPAEEEALERVTDSQPRPERSIYCIELRASESADDFIGEVNRIADSILPTISNDGVTAEQLQRFQQPTNNTFVGSSNDPNSELSSATIAGVAAVTSIEEHSGRRWYPVIDFSRCTNCMECIDFCLFGVYGVDTVDTILVEQPDNCRKGCPACSRVCPQNAIIFPQHKTPAIAGAPVEAGGLKIDLSKLFGAPETDEDAAIVAARERDEQLILAGRNPVGVASGLAERLADQPKSTNPDELDGLLDQLDSLDL